MKFTDERMIPERDKGNEIYLEHISRYIFASRFVKNKVVLDIACGSGYGSDFLKKKGAKKVIGIDISPEAISYCKANYKNINFLVGGVDKIPLKDKSVDLIVSFETIEHVEEKTQNNFIQEVKRILKPDGLFIVSTPNTVVFPKGNPFHLKELGKKEFYNLLRESFKNVQICYQDDFEISVIYKDGGLEDKSIQTEVDRSIIFQTTQDHCLLAMYLLAICSNTEKFEMTRTELVLSDIQTWKKTFEVDNLSKEISNLFEKYTSLKEEKNQKNLEINQKNLEINQKNLEIKEYEKIVQDREARINAIVNSMRWKVPNYVYKIYKNKLKKYIPRFIFKIKDGVLISIKFTAKYARLLKLAWEEYRITGWEGLKVAIERHYNKKNTETISYPKVDDYIPNLVTIGILTKDRLDLIKPCIESIEKYPSDKYKTEILIGDTGTTDKKVLKYYEGIKKKYRNIRLINFKRYFFSKNYNDLMSHAKGRYLIFLNNDTVVKEGWIDNLIDPLKDKKIGIVGGKLLYKNKTIQHAGVEVDIIGQPYHIYSKENSDLKKTSYKAILPSVTFACVAMRHDVFCRFRLSEEYKEESQDTDFNFRLHKAGFQVLYNPAAEIYHLECSSRDWRRGENDRQLFKKKWAGYLQELTSNHQNQRIKFDENQYKNSITVIRDDGIGDLLMCVSAFKKLREKHPDKKLILATYERNIEMMSGFGIFNEFIPIPNGQKYSPLPIPGDSKIYNLISFEMKVTATEGIPTEANKIHRHLVFSKILELDDEFKLVPMPDYPEARQAVKKLFNDLKININQKFVVINLVSTNPARSWWEPYYPALTKTIEKMGFVPIIVGTKDSKYYQGKGIINLVGKTKTIAEFIEVIKLGKYVISTDTSAYHIAALSGIPFLAIFTGGVLPEARLKYYKKYEVLEPPKSLKCYPCWDEGCSDPAVRWQKDPCRLIIKPEQVIMKFKKLVEEYPVK